ncbi:hypothetical protein CROQUDRAFT_655580 [Cronartium quercuum f. sp. fusiforme G11]|uniref:Uncharacterized protein n=1 Tax=Cronartium quercuum f. sp. fusiforme G11 TaxID=708437 RepID=A0A9P6TD15_9BASI|nr:hypothetical protein CROQUDRAFT_655580 [Cronartium quercuum f. sp. fusiforme G11]
MAGPITFLNLNSFNSFSSSSQDSSTCPNSFPSTPSPTHLKCITTTMKLKNQTELKISFPTKNQLCSQTHQHQPSNPIQTLSNQQILHKTIARPLPTPLKIIPSTSNPSTSSTPSNSQHHSSSTSSHNHSKPAKQLGTFTDAFDFLASQKIYWQSRANHLSAHLSSPSPTPQNSPDQLEPNQLHFTRIRTRRAIKSIKTRRTRHQKVNPSNPLQPNSNHQSNSRNRRYRSRQKISNLVTSINHDQQHQAASSTTTKPPSNLSTIDTYLTDGLQPILPSPPHQLHHSMISDQTHPPQVPKFKRGLAAQAASELLQYAAAPLHMASLLHYESPIPYYYGDIPRNYVAPTLHQPRLGIGRGGLHHSHSLPLDRHRHSISTFSFSHSFSTAPPHHHPTLSRDLNLCQTSHHQSSIRPSTSPTSFNSIELPLTFTEKSILLENKLSQLKQYNENRPTFIFIDHSNVIWSFLKCLNLTRPNLDVKDESKFQRFGNSQRPKLRLDYNTLFKIIQRNRNYILRKYIVASNPVYQPDMIQYWESMGYEIAILDPVVNRNPTTKRVSSSASKLNHRSSIVEGVLKRNSCTDSDSDPSSPYFLPSSSNVPLRYKEQAVDEVIQLNMIDTVMEFDWKGLNDSRPRPILTLVSGDANAGEYSKSGFSGWVVRCLKLGWDVEIIGFKRSISNRWLQIEEVGRIHGSGKLTVFTLDEFIDELVADVA